MNLPRLKKWSERQQVLATILMAGAMLCALWFFLLAPVNSRRSRLERDIETMRSQLAAKNYLFGEDVLLKRVHDEDEYERAIRAEWTNTVGRLSFLPKRELADEDEVAHIDFKVALFEVRQRLQRKSRQLNISLPHDLGMNDEVTSSEDARKLMLQLQAVETLVDTALDMKIDKLREITPLDPIPGGTSGTNTYYEEYPVEAVFYGDMQNVQDLFRAVLKPEQTFVLRRLQIESTARDTPGLLTVRAVLSALVFLKSPEQMGQLTEVKPAARRSVPMGY